MGKKTGATAPQNAPAGPDQAAERDARLWAAMSEMLWAVVMLPALQWLTKGYEQTPDLFSRKWTEELVTEMIEVGNEQDTGT